jgi:hypothetical protein
MFQANIQQWKTTEEFAAYLQTLSKPSWAKAVVVHHTWKPVESQWRGRATMDGLKRYYEQQMRWNAGPHLFVCVGAPNPADDGIWMLTPLDVVGIHAGSCNSSSWGVEVVGNFDQAPWSVALSTFMHDLLAVLLRKLEAKSVTEKTLRGHRECNSPKTCPGKQINMDALRDTMQQILFPNKEVVSRNSSILSPARCSEAKAFAYLNGRGGWYSDNELKTVIVPAYYRHASIVKVDPAVAIAQMIHETGFLTSWWSNRPRRNPAGIGVTGQSSIEEPDNLLEWAYNERTKKWHKGLSFMTWESHAIPAHIARLLAYATKPIDRNSEQQQFIDKYTKERPVPVSVIGKSPTLAGLEATWAYPGVGYADKLALHVNTMMR